MSGSKGEIRNGRGASKEENLSRATASKMDSDAGLLLESNSKNGLEPSKGRAGRGGGSIVSNEGPLSLSRLRIKARSFEERPKPPP